MRQLNISGHIYLLLALSIFAAAIAGAEPVEPAASRAAIEVQANSFTDSAQEQVAVDASPGGQTLAVWASRRQESGSYGVYARAFDAQGRQLSGEIHVNRTLRGAQYRPAVAVAADGSAWVAWESTGQDGSGSAIVARRLGADFAPVGGEIAVNVVRQDDQSSASVTTDSRGRALIVWSSSRPTAGTAAIRGRLFAADGRPLGSEIRLSDGARDDLPTVVGLPGDRFLVVWARRDSNDGHYGIYGRLIEAGGEVRGGELVLAPSAARAQIEPAVAADASGRFAVAWLAEQQAGYDVVVRRFGAGGEPSSEAQLIAEAGSGWKSGVAVAMAPDGRFAVSYNSDGPDGDGEGVYAQFFAADGRWTETRRVNQATRGDQAAALASGARRSVWTAEDLLVFAWHGDSDHGDRSAANLTLLPPTGLKIAAVGEPGQAQRRKVSPAKATGTEPGDELAAIPPIWDPDFVPRKRRPVGQRVGGDFGFEAIPSTGWTPPDPELAVGPDRIVVIANGAIAAFTKDGTEQWSDEIEDSFGFWGELGADNFVFDPEAVFDPHSQRFFAMANERSDDARSFFLFAVSKDESPDDRDDWHKYRLDVTPLAANNIDSPNMGLSRDFVLLTADFFGPDRYLLYIIDKSSVLEGGAAVTTHELITGSQSMGEPVVTSDTATLYIVQSTELGSNTTVILHAITDPFTAYQRQTFNLTVPTYTFPAPPPQQGTSSRPTLFEPRFWSTAEHDGSIWAVHHVNNSRVRARWYEIDLAGWPGTRGMPSLTQSGELDLGEGISTFFPSIQVDAVGNAAITFARSASNEFISIGRAVRAAGDPVDTFRPVQVVETSTNPHTTGRWGDYSGTWADPILDNTFWGHHELSGDTASSWRTWVARYDIRPEPMLLEINPIVAGGEITLSVTGATPGETVFFYQTLDGTGLTEIPSLGVTLSLENAVEVSSAVADENGVATTTASLALGTLVQAAESNLTTNWLEVQLAPAIFADSFESGDTSAWTNTNF